MISDSSRDRLLADVDVVSAGDGPVVALAHGAGGGVRQNFGALLQSAESQFHLVGPYYPGAGSTPLPDGPLDVDRLADTVVATGLAAGADRFPIVGLSLGCAVAITAATRHPEHVSGLVLTVGFGRPDAQVDAFAAIWQTLAARGDLDALGELMLYAASSPNTLARLSPAQHREVAEAIAATYPTGGAAHAELVTRVEVTPLLRHLDVPTLVVVAGQDRIVLPDSTRTLAQAIRHAELIEYPDAGHIFTADEATIWVADVEAFLHRITW